MSRISFLPQERPESCVPACLRMVLASFNVTISESELYSCSQTDIDGTLPSLAVQCVENLGFTASSIRLPDLATLLYHINDGYVHPIVFVNLGPLLGLNLLHAVVVEKIDTESGVVHVIDPAHPPTGERAWPQALFETGWRMARGQTILIRT